LLTFTAHYRGSTGQDKRSLTTSQQVQPPLERDPQISARRHQPAQGPASSESYQGHTTPPSTYEDFQTSLPSITSLLGTVQQSQPQSISPHRRTLSKAQSSPNIRGQTREPRSPFPGSTRRPRSQVFNPQIPTSLPPRRESGSVVVSQPWRDDHPLHEQFLPQPSYQMEAHAQRSQAPQISPVRTNIQPPYISPQETTPIQGFDFPYYGSTDPTIATGLSAPSPNPFYVPQASAPYLAPTSEMISMPPSYPFSAVPPNVSPSGVTYVGDSRALLPGRAVSMGTLRLPQRLGVSPQEEDKRRRAASASARFRRRKKEQEEENLKEIARLEKRIEELKKE